MNTLKFKISPKIEKHIRKGHPWLFDNSIIKQSGDGVPGDLAVIYDKSNQFLAIGLYDPLSVIRIKILQANKQVNIDGDFFEKRLKAAFDLRIPLLKSETNGYRLVHGENDGFPGLVIDKYDKTLVVKIYSAIWIPYLDGLIKKILLLVPAERIVLRLSQMASRKKEYLNGLESGSVLHGSKPDGPVIFLENGLKFESDVIHGQKTGFFLDQRENRARVEKLSSGKKVLNAFCYSGGFSVCASRGGARSVLNIDISQKALDAADRNLRLNYDTGNTRKTENKFIKGDAFAELSKLRENRESFDMVIIDPPSFTKKESEIETGIKAYEKLTKLGLKLLRKGGVYVQSSCSSRISSEEFFSTVKNTASGEGYRLIEIERTGHPIDHPIRFKEGEYLKCLFARIN